MNFYCCWRFRANLQAKIRRKCRRCRCLLLSTLFLWVAHACVCVHVLLYLCMQTNNSINSSLPPIFLAFNLKNFCCIFFFFALLKKKLKRVRCVQMIHPNSNAYKNTLTRLAEGVGERVKKMRILCVCSAYDISIVYRTSIEFLFAHDNRRRAEIERVSERERDTETRF